MKVQCDVCESAEATLFCCADEASLCAECDKRVHAANKLASKHQRVALLYPAPEELPCCDICQDKTGYFFCLEDRAILCRNCDYSVHSANTLAAKHKRFLVSGIRVALQVMSSIDAAEDPQACSPLQVSSPTAHVSKHVSPQGIHLSSPTAQTTHLSTPRIPCVQKPSRMTQALPFPSVPEETSQTHRQGIRDESNSSPPPLCSLPLQNQTEFTPPVTEQGRNKVVVDPFLPKVVGTSASRTLLPPSLNQQFFFDGGTTWGTRSNMDVGAQYLGRGQTLTNQRSVGGGISEYLTEAMPGWRVDELFNLPDMDGPYNSGSSKASVLNIGDVDWPAESSGSEDVGLCAALAEVPSIPSPPTASGATKRWGLVKSLKEPDLDFFLHCDDTLVVPDIGGIESPTRLSPTSHSQKRRRIFREL